MKTRILKELFAGFLRTRRFVRHFRRIALLETVTRTGVGREVPPSLARQLVAAATSDIRFLLLRLGSHVDGLSEAQAEAIRERVGPNEVAHEKPLPWWVHLWHCYKTPFSLLLSVLAVVSYVTEDVKSTIVISSMVVLATLIRFVQEAKSNRAADKLKAMVHTTATVMRRDVSEEAAPVFEEYYGVRLHVKPARRIELPIKELVPGDVIALSAGDMIPADCRLLTAKDLFVNQAAMTGESLPVEKFAEQRTPDTSNPLELDNILFMGTTVVSGTATAVVIATGNGTYFGALAERVISATTMRRPSSRSASTT